MLIRSARQEADLSQDELAARAHTSQPTVASYEAGRRAPRLDTLARLLDACDYELDIEARPRVRRGAVPIAEVARQFTSIAAAEGSRAAWRRLLDFVDDFRASPRAGQRALVRDAPASTGERRFDAAIAALVELLCAEVDFRHPDWTEEPERFAEPWWFVSELEGFEAMALRDSPVSFARHGVFVNEGAFDRV